MKAIAFYLLMLQKYIKEAKDSEIEKYPLCSGNISGDFSAHNIKKKQIK